MSSLILPERELLVPDYIPGEWLPPQPFDKAPINPTCGRMVLRQMRRVTTPTFDSVSSSANAASGNASWTHTTVASNNTVALICVATRSTGTLTTVTWGGVSCTPITGTGTGAASQPLTQPATSSWLVRLWLIINPPTGAQTITVSGTSLTNTRCTSIAYADAAGVAAVNVQARTTTGAFSVGVQSTLTQTIVLLGGATATTSSTFASISGTSRVYTGAGGANTPSLFINDFQGANNTVGTGLATLGGSGTVGAAVYALTIVGIGQETCWTALAAGNHVASAGPLTFTSTAPNSDSYTVALVMAALSTGTNGVPSFSATYGGVAMTMVGIQATGATTSRGAVAQFVLFNPPTGAQTVSISSVGVTATRIAGQCLIYRNVATYSTATPITNLGITITTQAYSMAIAGHVSGTTAALSGTLPRYQCWTGVISVTGVGDAFEMEQDAGTATSVTLTATGTATSPGSVGVCLIGRGF